MKDVRVKKKKTEMAFSKTFLLSFFQLLNYNEWCRLLKNLFKNFLHYKYSKKSVKYYFGRWRGEA